MRKSKFFAVLILSLLMVIPLAGCDLIEDILWHWSRNKDVEVTTTEASHGVYQMNLNETRLIKAAYDLTTVRRMNCFSLHRRNDRRLR